MTTQRIGLFGGTFDPVHLGHLLVARAALEELPLNRLFVIPAARSPFKPDRQPASDDARLRLLRLAFSSQTDCGIDARELERGGVSYTVDTVRDYAERFPGAQLFWLIGADHVPTLPKWRKADQLASLVEFVAVPRPGKAAVSFPEPFRGRMLVGHPLELSASKIRQRIREGHSVNHLVPHHVGDAIQRLALYRSGEDQDL